MKLSNYIESLQHLLDTDGDIDCVTWEDNDDLDSSTEGWFSPISKEELLSYIRNRLGTACTYISNSGEKAYYSQNLSGYIDCRKEKVFFIKN